MITLYPPKRPILINRLLHIFVYCSVDISLQKGGPTVLYFIRRRRSSLLAISICLLLVFSACQSEPVAKTPQAPSGTTALPTASPLAVQVPGHTSSQPSPTPKATPSPTAASQSSSGRPVMAFYYMWYNAKTWNTSTMSDLPATQYTSSADATVASQVTSAANAGLTGFISSWWGPGDQTDVNFAKLLAQSATLENKTQYRFASTIYFECDAPALQGTSKIVTALNYMLSRYASNPNFFHWQGKPVFYFWNPLGNGRTLAQWASIRSQVDPNNQTIWSAEGVSTTLLSVFDGLHLFSGGYWGLQGNTMAAVDAGFRAKIDAYNAANGTRKIWAAGIIPGYNDTRVPGRKGAYIVPRNNGATYTTSWNAALASNPDWVTITSFNEWFEGSTIEPSATYGTLYLDLTRQFARQ